MSKRKLSDCEFIEAAIDLIIGQTVEAVSLFQYSNMLYISGNTSFTACSIWELSNDKGIVIDRDYSLNERPSFELWRVSGCKIVDLEIGMKRGESITFYFDNGWRLTAPNTFEGYTDWSLGGPGFSIIFEWNMILFDHKQKMPNGFILNSRIRWKRMWKDLRESK